MEKPINENCVDLREKLKKTFLSKYEPIKHTEQENSTLTIRSDRVEMQFRLKQATENHCSRKNISTLTRLPFHPHIISFPGFRGTIACSFHPDTGVMDLEIRFTWNLPEYMPGEERPETVRLLEQLPGAPFRYPIERNGNIAPQMRVVINDILHCDKSGTAKQLFWQSKILELLMLHIEQIDNENKPVSSVKYYDIQKLQEAKSIVENNLTEPYSLKKLARKVGLNDFKLKKGFKELYGYTVFGYLHELRMQKAKKMLISGNESVADVSFEVGYQHPHHFSAAFKRRFGVLPGSLNK